MSPWSDSYLVNNFIDREKITNQVTVFKALNPTLKVMGAPERF